MKKLLILPMAVLLIGSTSFAKTRIAVSTFQDKTGNNSRCTLHWWAGNELGSGFRDQIVTALMNQGKYEVVERENLRTMYDEEHELINSDKSTLPEKNKFKAAHYSITGAVTSFELCNEGIGGKVDVGGLLGFSNSGLTLGARSQKAKVVIDLRIVDVTTGAVAGSFRAEGKSTSTNISAEGNIRGSEFGSDAFNSSPIGEATREAIENAVSQISKKVPTNRAN